MRTASIFCALIGASLIACGSSGPNDALDLPTREDPKPATPPADEPAEQTDPAPAVVCADQTATFTPMRPKTNVLFVLDRSGSMQMKLASGGTRWTATRDALFAMLGALPAMNSRANVMQFPSGDAPLDTCCKIDAQNAVACTCSTYPTPAKRCSPATYAPKAPVDLDAASIQEMENRVSASNTHFYWGTPLAAAVKAAVDAQKASTNDGIKSVVILTDGAPTSCDTTADPGANDISHVIDAAKSGNDGSAGAIRTFVVGVTDTSNGAPADLLSQVAVAGGTPRAMGCEAKKSCFYGVDAAKLKTDLPSALAAIARDATDCTFDMPPASATTDLDKVNVTVTSAGASTVIARDPAQAEGWDYVSGKTRFKLFGNACRAVQADANAKVDVVVGCKTQTAEGQ
jgi:hypothetical protein